MYVAALRNRLSLNLLCDLVLVNALNHFARFHDWKMKKKGMQK